MQQTSTTDLITNGLPRRVTLLKDKYQRSLTDPRDGIVL